MTKKQEKKKIWPKVLLGSIVAVTAIYLGTCFYFINYSFGKHTRPETNQEHEDAKWLASVKKQNWYEIAVGNKDIKLTAIYVPAAVKTNKTIVVAHGWHENYNIMSPYIKMFHNLGYNVLAPDDRGCGKSGGKYLSMGWLDRLDYVKWIHQLIAKEGPDIKIGLFGVSMGGATVMNVSGEKLPSQVKCVVEDCGFTSVNEEFSNVVREKFHIAPALILPLGSKIADPFIGFDLEKASTLNQLKNNKLPIFFIHGGADKFVKTYMVYKNYDATTALKQIWVTKGAGHADSYRDYPVEYQQKVGAFFDKYLN